MSLKAFLKIITNKIKNLSNELNTKKNNTYRAAGSKANSYAKTLDLCSITVPKGQYLVLGNVDASVSNDNSIVAVFLKAGTGSSIVVNGSARGSMAAGGGCTGIWLVDVTADNALITLQTYGYYNGSYTHYGRMIAIRLI